MATCKEKNDNTMKRRKISETTTLFNHEPSQPQRCSFAINLARDVALAAALPAEPAFTLGSARFLRRLFVLGPSTCRRLRRTPFALLLCGETAPAAPGPRNAGRTPIRIHPRHDLIPGAQRIRNRDAQPQRTSSFPSSPAIPTTRHHVHLYSQASASARPPGMQGKRLARAPSATLRADTHTPCSLRPRIAFATPLPARSFTGVPRQGRYVHDAARESPQIRSLFPAARQHRVTFRLRTHRPLASPSLIPAAARPTQARASWYQSHMRLRTRAFFVGQLLVFLDNRAAADLARLSPELHRRPIEDAPRTLLDSSARLRLRLSITMQEAEAADSVLLRPRVRDISPPPLACTGIRCPAYRLTVLAMIYSLKPPLSVPQVNTFFLNSALFTQHCE
ncbi:hypothetical protein C8J57DRAFT_1723224 [Mycena rebaudengoi]|nr:hypothetical protein C8J57DRAFT_1723224 [Mycena rebaudengoi]